MAGDIVMQSVGIAMQYVELLDGKCWASQWKMLAY